MLVGWGLMTAVVANLGLAQDAGTPRNWVTGDPGIRFTAETTSPPIATLGSWSGSVVISVRCTVEPDGSLDACAVIDESRPRLLSHRSARVEVRKMRLELYEEGPQPGDTLTVEAVITRP